MCCFSRAVTRVSGTRIFARPLEGGRQLLVYGMTVDIPEDLAMVLPIPVPADGPDDAVKFVDLSGCPKLFDDLAALFPVALSASGGFGAPQPASRAAAPKLVVHEVGDFEASFVPRPRDFDRLDERFRLPGDVFEKMRAYADWGFAVFKLKAKGKGKGGKKRGFLSGLFGGGGGGGGRSGAGGADADGEQTIHPMAFEFPRRDASALFFPTVHVHDGEVHPTAHFDHELYCQVEPAWAALFDWERSNMKSDMLAPPARPFVAEAAWVYKRGMHGELANKDTFVGEAKLRARNAIGESFRLRMKAAWEHVVDDGTRELDPNVKKWLRVSEAERVRIKESVAGELSAFFASEAGTALGLAPFAPDLQVVYPAMYAAASSGGPSRSPFGPPVAFAMPAIDARGCVASFFAQTDRLEPQELTVAFAAMPSKEACDAVQTAFQTALDRASRA